MAQVANVAAAQIAFACVAWLFWPAGRDHPAGPAYAAAAGVSIGAAVVASLVLFEGRTDPAIAVGLGCALLDLAGVALRRPIHSPGGACPSRR